MRSSAPILRFVSGPCLLLALALGPQTALAGPTDAIHARALEAFHALQQRQPQVEADWKAGQPGIHMLLGLDEPLLGATPALRAEGFLHANEALLGVPARAFRAVDPSISRQRTVLKFQQIVRIGDKDVRVLDAEVTLTFDNSNGHLLRVVSGAVPVGNLPRGVLTRDDAVAKATQAVAGATFGRGSAATAEEAAIVGRMGARHVWIVHVPGASPRDLRTLAVDAKTGEVTRMPNRVLD